MLPRSLALTQPFTHSLFLEDGAVGECDLEGAVRVRDDEGDLPHAPESKQWGHSVVQKMRRRFNRYSFEGNSKGNIIWGIHLLRPRP